MGDKIKSLFAGLTPECTPDGTGQDFTQAQCLAKKGPGYYCGALSKCEPLKQAGEVCSVVYPDACASKVCQIQAGGATSGGICVDPGKVGWPCDTNPDAKKPTIAGPDGKPIGCALDAGFFCDRSKGPTCQPTVAANQYCLPDPVGVASHPEFNPCGPGATCSSASKCVPLSKPGESCVSNGDCTTGNTCVLGKCVTGVPHSENMPCTLPTQDCNTGLFCDGSTCKKLRKENELCSGPAVPNGGCETGLVCGSDLKCHSTAVEGESCSPAGSPGNCSDGMTCSSLSKCVPLGTDGASCTLGAIASDDVKSRIGINAVMGCAEGYSCSGLSKCRPQGNPGDSCNAALDPGNFCKSTRCGGDGKCTTLKASGEVCVLNNECSSGKCQATTTTLTGSNNKMNMFRAFVIGGGTTTTTTTTSSTKKCV